MTDPAGISVIIPVYNGAGTLTAALDSVSNAIPAPNEIIVVDDGSTDNSASIASNFGVRVVKLEQNAGAAAAKNRGAKEAVSDIVLFIDSDILIPPDTMQRLRVDLADRSCSGVVGLLDEGIPSGRFATQFKNLWMNYTYRRFERADCIGLFYTSIAAMRRDAFNRTGGFDQRYKGSSIAEDTEFGQRAWASGLKIRLDPTIKVIHLKEYSLLGLLREDFRRARALTLMRLRKWNQPFFTSVPFTYQVSVPLLYLAVVFLFISPLNWALLWVSLAFLAAVFALNLPFLLFLARRRGPLIALQSAFFLPVELLSVGIGMLSSTLDFVRGRHF